MSFTASTARRATGFSLIEMLTTMSVLAILLAIASPGPGLADLGQLAERGARRAGGGDDAGARRGAQARHTGRDCATSPSGGAEFNGGWTVFVDTNGNGVLDTGETIVRVQPAFRGDMRVTTTDGQTVLAFNGRGFLTPSAAVTFAVCSSLAPKSYRIRIEPVGLADVSRGDGLPMSAPRPRRRRAEGGYVLLEALIAVVIAAVGFIGAARMQTLGLAMNNSTQVRQKATLLGYQMADRIRANQAGVSARAYDLPTAGSTDCLVAVTGCTPTQLAAADVGEWQSEIAAQLPAAPASSASTARPTTARRSAAMRRRRQHHRGQAVVGRQGRHAAFRRQRAAMRRAPDSARAAARAA